MIVDFLNNLIPSIEHIGVLGYWLVLLLFFVEGIIFFGLFVPGTFIAIFLGALAARGVFHLGDLIIFSSLGFFLGDLLSFSLGGRGTNLFKEENKILKLAHLENGRQFFEKHGAKSVFLGRFIGLLRPLTPFIAGLSKMKLYRFLFLNALSIILWVTLHLFLGYFFGQAFSLIKLWSSRLEMLLFVSLAFLTIFYSLKWLIFKKGKGFWLVVSSIWSSIKAAVMANPEFIKFTSAHPRLSTFFQKRFAKEKFSGQPLTILSFVFVYFIYLLSKIIFGVVTQSQIVAADSRVENLLHAFRSLPLIKTFLFLTYLGKAEIIIIFALGLTIYLRYAKKSSYLIPFWLTLTGAGLTNYLLKIFFERPRPALSYYLETSFSFPSLHASLAVAFYGFLIYLGWQNLNAWKAKVNWLFGWLFVIIIIGISRAYLDVHFLSDVWGGYLVGGLWLVIGIAIHLAKTYGVQAVTPLPETGSKRLLWTIVAAEFLVFVSMAQYYQTKINLNPIEPATEVVTNDILKTFDEYHLARTSEALTGRAQEPLNLVISAKNDQDLIAKIERIGWKKSDRFNLDAFKEIIKLVILKEPYETMPTVRTFWETNINDLAFKRIEQEKHLKEKHLLSFWKTGFKTPNGKEIYVGVASMELSGKLLPGYKLDPDLDSERESIFNGLKDKKLIASWSRHQFIEPVLGETAKGEQFFTDGKIYIIDLR